MEIMSMIAQGEGSHVIERKKCEMRKIKAISREIKDSKSRNCFSIARLSTIFVILWWHIMEKVVGRRKIALRTWITARILCHDTWMC